MPRGDPFLRPAADLDVLVFGGGAAGLWTLDTLRSTGWAAALVENRALGAGQTIQAQGIIHGGGKYTLRGVRDLRAGRAVREMPGHWRECFSGKRRPDLSRARFSSEECLLWLPKESFRGDPKSKVLMSVVVNAGLMSTKPVEMKTSAWPEVLRGSALKVYSMAEPVVETGSLLEALAAPHRGSTFRADKSEFRGAQVNFRSPDISLRPRALVFAAGAGNEALLAAAGIASAPMQRRPLLMAMLRGNNLPRLFAHCVVDGRTRLTITTVEDRAGRRVWQIGGEVAERSAAATDLAAARAAAASEIRRFIPPLDLSAVEIATYAAVRAEAKNSDSKRPSGVHVQEVAGSPLTLVAWPTKLALTPVLANEVVQQITRRLGRPGRYRPALSVGPPPEVARPPWEEAEWFPVS